MDPFYHELAKQGPLGVVLAVLLYIHAKHVSRMVDAMASIAPALEKLIAKIEGMSNGK